MNPYKLATLVCLGFFTLTINAIAKPFPASAVGTVHPRVSPDGSQIAASYQGALHIVPVEGGILKRVTHGTDWDTVPVWSPKGDRIAYLNGRDPRGGTLRVINTSNHSNVDLPTVVQGRGPLFFSRDGNKVLGRLSENRNAQNPAWVDLETGAVVELKIRQVDPSVISFNRLSYCLSTDGSKIVYVMHQDVLGEQSGNQGPMADVYVMDVDGMNQKKLFQWPARIYSLTADPKSNAIYAVTDLGTAHNDIWHIPLRDSLKKAKRLTFGMADEQWVSVSNDGMSLVYGDNRHGPAGIVVSQPLSPQEKWVPIHGIDFGVEEGTLDLEVFENGAPTVARISLRKIGGKFHSPPGSLYRFTLGIGHFYTDSASFSVPAGNYKLVALKGPEFIPFEKSISVSGGGTTKVSVQLKPWINMGERGWYSGENHVHANYGYGSWYNNPATLMRQCQGEDLNVCNAVVANSDGDGVYDREFFLGRSDPHSEPNHILYWNQEFRATLWGHMTLFNLSQLVEPVFTGFKHTTNPWDVPTNAEVASHTHEQDGIVSYTHPAGNPKDLYDQAYAAKGLPVDAALGRIDSMDIMGHAYVGSVELWYRLLNSGLNVSAAAGTDCFLNRIASYPPGWGRAYVKIPDGLSYSAWVNGQRDGRAFVTNGPMVFLEVEGTGLSNTVHLAGDRAVAIKAEARSHFPMESADLIFNGESIRKLKITEDGKLASFDGKLLIETSGWLALRVAGPGGPYIIRNELYAHTNPVFIDMKDKPLNSPEDAAYFIKWIDRLEADFEKRKQYPNEKSRLRVLRELNDARLVYQNIIGQN
ncbi:MAG: CehA/McbA family metallohydrolase [Verrucomicrobia bacterium]|nr:CehA/McbA family metallohydrolase [Verrucomicrobiota bacterium]